MRVWDAANGAELHCLRGHEDSVSSVSFSPDGQWIVSGSRDQTVRVWDAASGAELFCLHGHEDSVWSVSYSPNGERIVSRSGDGTVRVWDATSGAELHCLRGHQDEVTSVSYSSDGQRIVSGSRDLTLRLWDAETFACQEVMTGLGDVAAIATGATVFPWRAIARGLETVIEDAVTGRPIAWFPVAFGHITTHPSGRQWVGTSRNSNHVYLFNLKGPPPEDRFTEFVRPWITTK